MERSTKVLLSSIGLIAVVLFFGFARTPLRFYWLTKTVQFYPKNADNLCELGKMYYKGKGAQRDVTKAFGCFQKSANLGNPKAHYKLGNMYAHKRGMEKGPETNPSFWESIPLDYEKAIDYYFKAAMQENPKAYCQLGYFNFKGIGMSVNRKKAFTWYNRAAAKESAIGSLWLGCFYSHGAGLAEGIEPPLTLGDTNCKERILFDYWGGVKLNYALAIRFYTMAAKKENAAAQCQLGYLYSHGEVFFGEPIKNTWDFPGIEKNLETAVKWYTLAAEQGDLIAQCRLGYFSLRGFGVEKNNSKAFYWFSKAAYQDFNVAQCWVGSFYEFGIGVKANPKLAFKWYTRAARGGHEFADTYAKQLAHKFGLPCIKTCH